ncbi:serpin family protein [Eggerthella sp. YY7918]|uniref:serpin family protein n=1 Tax=Eggerthella sp. (strain YY7918) TaxID=502558 RepID=UPI00021718D1|nr:serpin family protein [Eggerthella sp. YY7918]BAK45132.1 hypothetical protein EGYY_20420 [Eggerthella sp. YY7918]
MKSSLTRRTFYLTLATIVVLALVGCAERALAATDLMANVTPQDVSSSAENLNDAQAEALTDFGVQLLQQSNAGEDNVLISPLSVQYALGMTANGSQGETRSQMEHVLGSDVERLNEQLLAYQQTLEASAEGAEDNASPLKLANSLWIRNGFEVNDAFQQTNANYYQAGAYQAPFDTGTKDDINQWVSDNTDGMIEQLLDEVPASAVMYLVNALGFDANWMNEYQAEDVHEETFTPEEGAPHPAQLMYSTESNYLENDRAIGFMKPYESGRYAFAALLPQEGTSMADFVATLTGDDVRTLLETARWDVEVDAAVPKFSSDYGCDLSKTLAAMGMTDAFDPSLADFSGIGTADDGTLYIGSVAHKTHIEVDEHGTKAAATTSVEMKATSAMPVEQETKVVHLDRPFVYAIIDLDTNVPIFLGSVMDVES